jgi:hypothetical protein
MSNYPQDSRVHAIRASRFIPTCVGNTLPSALERVRRSIFTFLFSQRDKVADSRFNVKRKVKVFLRYRYRAMPQQNANLRDGNSSLITQLRESPSCIVWGKFGYSYHRAVFSYYLEYANGRQTLAYFLIRAFGQASGDFPAADFIAPFSQAVGKDGFYRDYPRLVALACDFEYIAHLAALRWLLFHRVKGQAGEFVTAQARAKQQPQDNPIPPTFQVIAA